MEEKNARFTSEIKVDLPLFLEFLNLSIDVYKRNFVFRVIQVFLILHCITNLSQSPYIGLFLFLAILFPLTEWWNRRKYKDGGIAYKQLLFQHEGKIPHQFSRFEDDQLVFHNLTTGNDRATPYSQYVELWESKNLLVLILDVNMYQIIDKRTLSGGTSDELTAFLREKCPNLKKKVAKGKLGRFTRRLVWMLIGLGLVLTLLTALHIPEKLRGQITNDMSYEEIAGELASLGITIAPATMEEMKAYEDSAWELPGYRYKSHAKALYLLSWEGMGKFDSETWQWTPSTSGVYWFDLEAMHVSTMYTDFLTGVDAMEENLSFSNVTEDYSHVDMETGLGIVTFSFDYLGQTYTLNAQYQQDWFDTNMLTHMGKILRQDSDPKDLWYIFDGQGVLLYYGTAEEVRTLEQKTGLYFLDPVNQFLYSY